MKILVADDDAVTRKVLKAFLTQLNYEAEIVDNGARALEILQGKGAPMIAIIDWLMPDMEGVEVCRRIRGLEQTPDPYVIILTVKKEKADIANALDAGADDVLSKPFNILEMSARLRVAERSIKRQLKGRGELPKRKSETASGLKRASAAPHSVKATPPAPPAEPALAGFTVKRTHEIVAEVLGDVGVFNASASVQDLSGIGRSGGFTTWSGFVLPATQQWLDVVLEIDDSSATAFYSGAHGDPATEHGVVMKFLKKFHASLIAALKGDVTTKGAPVLSPFSPVGSGATTLRLPEEFRRLKYSFPGSVLTVTFAVQPCPLQLKRPEQLISHEILAESYPKLKKEEVTLLNQGAVLNARFIDKIVAFDVSTEERQLVPVFQPSPLALDFLSLDLLPANRA